MGSPQKPMPSHPLCPVHACPRVGLCLDVGAHVYVRRFKTGKQTPNRSCVRRPLSTDRPQAERGAHHSPLGAHQVPSSHQQNICRTRCKCIHTQIHTRTHTHTYTPMVIIWLTYAHLFAHNHSSLCRYKIRLHFLSPVLKASAEIRMILFSNV